MDPTLRCARCGELIPADGGEIGENPICGRCAADGRESGPVTDDSKKAPASAPASGDDRRPVFASLHIPSPPDRTLTRTMLLPIPGMASGPPDAMIGRLEPQSLRWIELSDALQLFLG